MIDSLGKVDGTNATIGQIAKALNEAAGLLRGPQRVVPLIQKLVSDKIRVTFEQKHLYSYTTTKRSSTETLNLLLRWIRDAQRPDGGIAAYYSLLTRIFGVLPGSDGLHNPDALRLYAHDQRA